MMFLRHGDAATYHVGWSDAAQRLPGAHNLLLWQAMLQLRQAGVRRIDLGGVNTGRSAGVARFKIGTGGDVEVLAGTYLAL
jgi:lipid II:glycine glycyltransferase (peptidoglycan interpeptide bridge formation enzyme)